MNPLVSMITYCYNGERFVSKYFDAVLAQDYDNIELIFFNNGSMDRTGEIAEEYKVKLEARGIITHIIHYKENQCTCQLKQDAFHMMKGEYFFGCDSDDLIYQHDGRVFAKPSRKRNRILSAESDRRRNGYSEIDHEDDS